MDYDLLKFPPELLVQILDSLNINSILSLSSVSKQYSILRKNEYDEIWRTLMVRLLRKPPKYTYTCIQEYNDINCTKHLNWFQAYVYINGHTSFAGSIMRGNLELLRLHLLNPHLDVKIHYTYISGIFDSKFKGVGATLSLASLIDSPDILHELLSDDRFDPTDNNQFAFVTACECGNVQSVKKFLGDPRINPAYQNNEALIQASSCGQTEVVKLLLEDSRVDPTDQSDKAVMTAYTRNRQTANLLLRDRRVIYSLLNQTLGKHKVTQHLNNMRTMSDNVQRKSSIIALLSDIRQLMHTSNGKICLEALINLLDSEL